MGIKEGKAGLHAVQAGIQDAVHLRRFIRHGHTEVLHFFDIHPFFSVFIKPVEFQAFTRVIVVDQFVVPYAEGGMHGGTVGEVVHHFVADLPFPAHQQICITGIGAQEFGQIDAVHLQPGRIFTPRPGYNGGEEVTAIDHDMTFLIRLNSRSCDDQGNAYPTFLGVDLTLVQRVVIRKDLPRTAFHSPVIRTQDNVGVLDEFMSFPAGIVRNFQVIEDLPDIIIEHLHHGGIVWIALSRVFQAAGIGREGDIQLLAILFQQSFRAGLDGGVDQPGGVVEEKGFILGLFHECQGVFIVGIGWISVLINPVPVIFILSGEIR